MCILRNKMFHIWPQFNPDGKPRKRLKGRPGSVDADGVSKYPEGAGPKNGSPANLPDSAGGSTTPEGSSGAGADSPNSSGGDSKTIPDGSGSSEGSISGGEAATEPSGKSRKRRGNFKTQTCSNFYCVHSYLVFK